MWLNFGTLPDRMPVYLYTGITRGVRLTTFKWRGTHTVIVSRAESRNCDFMKLALARSWSFAGNVLKQNASNNEFPSFCSFYPDFQQYTQHVQLSFEVFLSVSIIWHSYANFFLVFLLSLICSTRLDITTKNGEAKIRCLKISIARCSKPIGLHMLKMRKQVCEIECSFNCSTVGCMLRGIKFDSHPSFWNMRRNNANHFPKIFSAGFQPSYFWHLIPTHCHIHNLLSHVRYKNGWRLRVAKFKINPLLDRAIASRQTQE